MTLPQVDLALLRRRHRKLPESAPKSYRYKVKPAQLQEAIELIKQGQSLRSAASSYQIDHKALRRRLIQVYGPGYSQALRTRHNLIPILNEYKAHPNRRLAAAAEQWLKQNLDLLLVDSDTRLLTERQERGFSYISVECNIEDNLAASGVW